MSIKYPGGFITKSPTIPTSLAAPGIWTLDQALSYTQQGSWPVAPFVGGALYIWGFPQYGETGNNVEANQYATDFTQIKADDTASWSNTPSLDMGDSHGIMVKTNGSLWTWGDRSFGQMGDGLGTGNTATQTKIGTLTNWSKVSAGVFHNLALKTDGTMWSWGYNIYGQVGDGTSISRSSPVQIGTQTDWASIHTDESSSFGVKTNGTLWAWGYNNSGQLGTNNTVSYSSPIQVGTLVDWLNASIAVGEQVTIAAKSNGTLWQWGEGSQNSIGDGLTINRSSPVQIGTLSTWSSVSATAYTVHAIKTDGTLWGWGLGSGGVLGDNASIIRSSPVQIGTLNNWSMIDGSSSGVSVVAVKTDGTLWGWGPATSSFLFGDGTTIDKSSPVQIGVLSEWDSAHISYNTIMAVKKSKALYSIGNNSSGTAGTGVATTPVSWLTQVGSLGYWKESLPNGSGNWMGFIDSSHGLWTWGQNGDGQLGDGTTTTRSSPVQIAGEWRLINAGVNGGYHGIRTSGTLWAWGNSASGMHGTNTAATLFRSSPVQVGTLSDWLHITTASNSVAALKGAGSRLFTWGSGQYGQLGSGTTLTRSSPVQVATGASEWIDVVAGPTFYIARRLDGTLWSWGRNNIGQLGDGTTLSRSSPIQIGTQTNWAGMHTSNQTVLVTKRDGTLWSWGQGNASGRLGDSTALSRSSPVQVGTLTNWASLGTGTPEHVMRATKTDGTLWGWTDNSFGPFGDSSLLKIIYSSPVQIGTQTNWAKVIHMSQTSVHYDTLGRVYLTGENTHGKVVTNTQQYLRATSSPVQLGSEKDWYAIGGFRNFAAIKNNGTLWGWGFNESGQVGDGTTINKSSPIQIGTLTNWGTALVTGVTYMYNIKTDGTLWAWGSNTYGELGNGTSTFRSSPVQIGTLNTWATAGTYSTDGGHAIKTDGTLWGWGYNGDGQIGDNTVIFRSSPVQIGTQTNWSKLSSGTNPVIAVKTDGTLWSWGQGIYGGNGRNDNVTSSSPVQIGTMTNWRAAFGRENVCFAIKTDGTLWGWGYNLGGWVGDGTNIDRSSPVQIGTQTNWASVDTGSSDYSIIALKTDRTIWTWGSGDIGQFGDGSKGSLNNRSSPVQIPGSWGAARGGIVAAAISR
jgi:alpha-tubulin suppressor-like RCC1 family protein